MTAVLLAVTLAACSGSSGELFGAGFESGDLSEWDHSQAIAERIEIVDDGAVEGSRAGRFEVRGGDEEPGTGAQRAEVVSGLEFDQGDVAYFRILARIESWDEGHWGMIWQLHDQSSGSPPLSLQQEIDESEQSLWVGSGDGSEIYWDEELPGEGEWFELVIRVEFGEEGSLEVWLNGEQQEMAHGETTYEGIDTLGEGPGYDKLGIYRSSSAEDTAVVFYDDYRVSEELFSDPPG
jgi:hypothetical protein